MAQARTLFYLGADPHSAYDVSARAHPLATKGRVNVLKDQSTLSFRGGWLEMGRSRELDSLDAFTVEARVTPERRERDKRVIPERRQRDKRLIRKRRQRDKQVILAGQTPPVTLFLERTGRLVGAINTRAGWVSVNSGRVEVPAGQTTDVRFTRDPQGTLQLEINGRPVGKTQARGTLVTTGEVGLTIGAEADVHADRFYGRISDVRIRAGAVSTEGIKLMQVQADEMAQRIRELLGAENVDVSPEPDEAELRLQQVKGIMNAAGVEDLAQLSTLTIDEDRVLGPGTVLVAPPKSDPGPDWVEIARGIADGSVMEIKKTIGVTMPNQNSVNYLKEVAEISGTPIVRPTEIPSIRPPDRPVIHLLRRRAELTPFTKKVFLLKSPAERASSINAVEEMVKVDGDLIKLPSEAVLTALEAAQPVGWPGLTTPHPITLTTTVIPVDSAVIIAETLDLTDKELQMQPEVEKLYIIAERVVCGPNAKITWLRRGGTTPPRAFDASKNGRSYYGIHTKSGSRDGLDGGDGLPGDPGIDGRSGRYAPSLEMWVKDLTAIPEIDLEGEDGIKGGRGQQGGHGGHGADGNWGEWYWFFGKHCWSEGGDGGDGGDGGQGGRGGRGGDGARGGDITIGVLEGTLASSVTAQEFRLNNSGGREGDGGDGGSGGVGGSGGRGGRGEVCLAADDGHRGADGQPGSDGPKGRHRGEGGWDEFFEFSEEAWDEKLTSPWLTQLTPSYAFPGSTLIISGSRFTEHDTVRIDGISLALTVRADESIEVTLPAGISAGRKEVYVRRQDGRESNRLALWIKPQLTSVPSNLFPGGEVTLGGCAFLNGASVLVDGDAIPANVLSATQLTFEMPGTGGAGTYEHSVTLEVRNPDGMVSNLRTASIPRIVEIGFRIGVHDFSFDNFASGAPSWSTFEDTFGALEVWHELLDPIFGHRILTAAFYSFYHYFLKGEDQGGLATGFCTSLSAVALEEFWTGSTDTHTRYSLDQATRERFTAIHGKLLSRETLITMHDQSREGLSRVESTFRQIEECFTLGCHLESAPLLFFIPSGAVWDEGYVDSLGKTHCIVPIRIVYPLGHDGTDIDGVKLYCWDCNHPPEEDTATNKISENCRLEFQRVGGEVHFDYYDGGTAPHFSSQGGITLGTMTNGEYLLSDHDLPFSGPLGLTTFVIDFLLSPASLQITDDTGLRTGRFGAQILAEIPNSHPFYLAKGAFMLPVNTPLTRRIVGEDTGNYAFRSILPDGASIALEDVPTNPGEEDILSVNADGSQIRFTPGVDKTFQLTLGRTVGSSIRGLRVTGVSGGPATDVDITISPELSVVRVGNRGTATTVDVRVFQVNEESLGRAQLEETGVNLPTNHDLVVAVPNWEALEISVQAIPFA